MYLKMLKYSWKKRIYSISHNFFLLFLKMYQLIFPDYLCSIIYNLDPSIIFFVKVIKLDFSDRVPVKFVDPLRSIRCMSSFFKKSRFAMSWTRTHISGSCSLNDWYIRTVHWLYWIKLTVFSNNFLTISTTVNLKFKHLNWYWAGDFLSTRKAGRT